MNAQVLEILKSSFWGTGEGEADRTVFQEMNNHKIAALAAPALEKCVNDPELLHEWERRITKQVGSYLRYEKAQSMLPITVPYVILKGTAAAKYYPFPEYRSMGDIDIMTSHSDYDTACEQLLRAGFKEEGKDARHREFVKNNTLVEIHASFTCVNDLKKTEKMNDLIISHINPTHYLPDPINGLVLLGHVSHHLEEGLGLRQIIDWMFFVDKCLPDQNWPAFQALARETGLEKLAIVLTGMCTMYLDLPSRAWCARANVDVCTQLMEYVYACGNFGRSMEEDTKASMGLFLYSCTIKDMFKMLQKRGSINLNSKQTASELKTLPWLYQIGRYARKGMHRKGTISKLVKEFRDGKRLRNLFRELGVEQGANGTVIFQDGNYRKD